jgi:hypothetical protein
LAIHRSQARFQVVVAHRRAGKTVCFVNHIISRAMLCPLPAGRYAYIAPTYKMAKRIAWDYLRTFTRGIRGMAFNQSELRADFPNGARAMLLGADTVHDLRGLYLDGAVLDEYALMSPRLFREVILPALLDRGGWAIVGGTPLGVNELKRAYDFAVSGDPGSENWQAHLLRASQTGAISAVDLAIARTNMREDEYAQEFECSFAAVIKGAYYSAEIQAAEVSGRVLDVPYDPALGVTIAVDLGMRDGFGIWALQEHPSGGQVRALRYAEFTGMGLPQVKREIDQWGYAITRWLAPHDIAVRELGTGRSRREVGLAIGMIFEPARRLGLADGIEAVRTVLPLMVFDRRNCAAGLDALRQYHAEFDDILSIEARQPVHDWSSHCADALRTYATSNSAIAASAFERAMLARQQGPILGAPRRTYRG